MTTSPFEGWMILELFGHRRLAGKVTEAEIAGGKFLRIDVPGEGEEWQATQYYGAAAIYAMTPTTETMARAFALNHRPEPAHEWDLRKALPASVTASTPPEFEDDERD